MSPWRHFSGRIETGLWLVGLTAALLVLLWALGEGVKSALQYERHAILGGGEWWRLFTGHFVHVDLRHTLLNVAGGLAMTALFYRTYSLRQWLLILAMSLIACDVGFVLRDKDLFTYVGFSGVLHGVLAAGSLAWWRTEPRLLAAAISVITLGKLSWEQWQGPVSLAGDNMRVIVNAHLYGAIGGGLAAVVLFATGRAPKRSAKQVGAQHV